MPRRVSSPELIGRGPELGMLLKALDDAEDGRFATVFVAGESGVGKSRLLLELERRTQARARHVAGECVMLGEGELPYAPIRSALRRLRAELGPRIFDELVGAGRGELARLLPQLRRPDDPAPADASEVEALAQARLFELLLGMLARLSDATPVVLTIEDIHWADHSTLDFLAFLIANARRERVLLVCSYRTDELHRRHPLRAFLAQHERPPRVRRVDLPPFTPEELAAQLHGILDAAPEPALVRRLHERSEGNAFFTEELLAASREGTQLPASLREALMLRIDALPQATQHVLRVAAAHGRVVTHRLVAAATDLPEAELHEAMRHAVNHNVLVRRDLASYAFRHALFAEALESDLLAGERMRLHLALAQAIEGDPTVVGDDGGAAAALCSHWLGAHRLPEALGAAVRAGIEAEQVYAFAESEAHFQRALDLWERVDEAEQRAGMDEGALCALVAEAAHLGGDGKTAVRLIRRAIELVEPQTDPYRAALLRERLGHYAWLFAGDDEGARVAYQEALDLLPAGEPRRERARLLGVLGQVLMVRGHMTQALEACEQGIAIARQTGGRAEEAHALNGLGGTLGLMGDRRNGIEHLRESLRMCEELGDLDGLSRAYVNLGELIDEDGRVEEAAELALEGAKRMGGVGMRDSRALLEGEAAGRLFKLGRLDEADRVTQDALDLQPLLGKQNQCAGRARIELQRLRPTPAESLLRTAEEAMPDAPATWLEPLASARVELELLRSRPEKARQVAQDALRAAEDEHVAFVARLHALGCRACAEHAERAQAAGDEEAAGAAAAAANELVGQMDRLLEPERWRGTPPREAAAYRGVCAAEAARAAGAGGASAWAGLAERWAQLGLRLEECYARLREAECHLLDGQRALAEGAVAAGRRLASDCGAAWLARDLDALARRGRLAAPRQGPAPEDSPGLTERERAVLELVALGMTNREIGEQLFMAPKTASVHVSRILTKLGVSSRVEAATAAQRLGLVP